MEIMNRFILSKIANAQDSERWETFLLIQNLIENQKITPKINYGLYKLKFVSLQFELDAFQNCPYREPGRMGRKYDHCPTIKNQKKFLKLSSTMNLETRCQLTITRELQDDFEFKCCVFEGQMEYVAHMSFLVAISSGNFAEEDAATQNDMEIPAVYLVKMLGHGIRQLICSNTYKLVSFSTEKGVCISFAHPLVKSCYILKIGIANFRTADISKLQQLVQKLSAKCDALESKLYSVHFFSRTEFMESAHWRFSAFDIEYNQNELLDNTTGAITSIVPKILESKEKEEITTLVSTHSIEGDQKWSKLLDKPGKALMMTQTSGHPCYLSFHDEKPIRWTTPKSPVGLRIESKDDQWFLRGAVRTKPGIFKTQNHTEYTEFMNNKIPVYVAEWISIKSFNDFIFGQPKHILGIIYDKLPNLASKYFFVEYELKGTGGQPDAYCYVMHQIQLQQLEPNSNSKQLTIQSFAAYQEQADFKEIQIVAEFEYRSRKCTSSEISKFCAFRVSLHPETKCIMSMSFDLPLFVC